MHSRKNPVHKPQRAQVWRYLLPVALLLLVAIFGFTRFRTQPQLASGITRYTYRIVNTFPHDPEAFTQGLVYHNGVLYESTGLYDGRSSLRRVALETGEVLQIRTLPDDVFAEGLELLNDRLYQLTWQNRVGYVYDRETFDLLETFSYETEGWGLTTDGSSLYLSDGSDTLFVFNPTTFDIEREIRVRRLGQPVRDLNELEWIDGQIYANIWQTYRIVRINPATGEVTGEIDLTGILTGRIPPGTPIDVLNGIAHDDETGRLFVTGKLWPLLFEIELVEEGRITN